MPSPTDTGYWDFMYQIMEYSVDSSTSARLLLDGHQVAVIDESTFLDELYAERVQEGFEERLIDYLLRSVPVLCIAAGRGSGKTSAIRFAMRRIQSTHPQVRVILLDIKHLYDQRRFQSLTLANAAQSFADFMRTVVQYELFPTTSDAREFFAWALAGAPDESDSFDPTLISDLYDYSNYVIAEAGLGEYGTRADRTGAIKDWLASHMNRYSALLREISPRLRTAHVVQGAITLRGYLKVVLIYDNVDRIPATLQPRFLEVANDSQLAMGSLCTTAIAIRRENIRRATPRSGEGGDIIHVLLPSDEEYPCILLPRVEGDHVQNVLGKRYAFSMQLYQKNLSGEDVQRLTDLRIQPVHLGVVSEFVSNSVHALANGSMRTIVDIYIGFMRYLRTLDQRGLFDLNTLFEPDADDEKHIKTLFFLWLREKGSGYGVALYDVLKAKESDTEANAFNIMASEHHLLMTCISNLTRKVRDSNVDRYPRFSLVYEYLSELGFTLPQVKRALKDLCAAPGEQPSVLEFHETDCDIDSLCETSDDAVRLTILGEELIREVCSKVGYVWGTAYHELSAKARGNISYHTLKRPQRIAIFYNYMRKMAAMHLKLLSLLQPTWLERHGDGWLERYRRRFGVGERLQVERILESAISFYKGDATPLKVLLEAYSALQGKIKSGVAFEDLDISELDRGKEYIERRQRKLFGG